jgi:hypothetical protein
MNYVVKKFVTDKDPNTKTLMFEHHNLVDPMELGLITL